MTDDTSKNLNLPQKNDRKKITDLEKANREIERLEDYGRVYHDSFIMANNFILALRDDITDSLKKYSKEKNNLSIKGKKVLRLCKYINKKLEIYFNKERTIYLKDTEHLYYPYYKNN
jgi:hypothetical protein